MAQLLTRSTCKWTATHRGTQDGLEFPTAPAGERTQDIAVSQMLNTKPSVDEPTHLNTLRSGSGHKDNAASWSTMARLSNELYATYPINLDAGTAPQTAPLGTRMISASAQMSSNQNRDVLSADAGLVEVSEWTAALIGSKLRWRNGAFAPTHSPR